jgi:hypothetical protein
VLFDAKTWRVQLIVQSRTEQSAPAHIKVPKDGGVGPPGARCDTDIFDEGYDELYTAQHGTWRFWERCCTQVPRVLIARDATARVVTSEIALSSIINILARHVSGNTSVELNAVAVEYARYR